MKYNHNYHRRTQNIGLGSAIFAIVFFLTMASAWITHVVWAVGTLASAAGATASQILLMILGVLAFPFGVIHGIMIWFGAGF